MKKYIKPEIEVTNIELQLLDSNSITSVSGADGLGTSTDVFNGDADSRYYDDWDD